LLPGDKLYADLTEGSTINADQGEEISPEGLLHEDVGSTSYQKLGTEEIAGRNTNKYRIVVNNSAAPNVSQSETVMWVDEALQMPIRSETKSADGTSLFKSLMSPAFMLARASAGTTAAESRSSTSIRSGC